MTSTDVRIVAALVTDSSKCVRVHVCGALGDTFPQSLKHDGTASERKAAIYSRHWSPVGTASQENLSI